MKTIGLIGGLSWESTAIYYRVINRGVQDRLGGVHSAKIVMISLDLAEIAELQHCDDWDSITGKLIDAARRLEQAGADCFMICTNTLHRLAGDVTAAVNIPILHIADAVGAAIKRKGLTKVGLLGTRYTMEGDFLKRKFFENYGVETIVPDEQNRAIVHRVIYEELVRGVLKDESRTEYLRIIGELTAAGAEGIILGCTEIPLLVRSGDTSAVLFDTTTIHAEKAVEFALEETARTV
jgi:aspartate racemase